MPPALPLKLPARLLLVDDHLIVQEGLKALLANHPEEISVVGCASNSREALDLAAKEKPDLILLDFFLGDEGDGLHLLREILRVSKRSRVLVFSLNRETDLAVRVMRHGAFGYLMKIEGIHKLMTALRALMAGRRFASAEVMAQIVEIHSRSPFDKEEQDIASLIHTLSPRELQVFQHIGAGLPTREIAARLFLSPKTIASHRESLKNKLNCQNSADLQQAARAWVQQSLQPV